MEKDIKISKITIGWGIYIIVSASFMLQVNEWLVLKVESAFLAACFWTFSALLLLAAILYAIKARLAIPKVFAAFSVFVLGYVLAMHQEYLAEKTHILSYGILGFLAAKDLIGDGRAWKPKNAALAISFVALISAFDEMFQLALPYRFGEIKDFATNMLSGALGMALFMALRKQPGGVK